MTEEQIAKAAADCLAVATGEQPYTRVAECLNRLTADPAWTTEDLFQVQGRVIRALLEREKS
jgi:hypothetical protein